VIGVGVWCVHTRLVLVLTISNPELGRIIFGSQNNCLKTNGINSAIRCYKEAVHYRLTRTYFYKFGQYRNGAESSNIVSAENESEA